MKTVVGTLPLNKSDLCTRPEIVSKGLVLGTISGRVRGWGKVGKSKFPKSSKKPWIFRVGCIFPHSEW